MTRLPTETSLRHLLDSLAALHQKPRDKRVTDRTLYANIERRLATAVRRDRTGDSIRDGYPSDTLAGGYSSFGGSPTETHALSRPERDRHHELTALACTSLSRAVTELQILLSALNSIDDLTADHTPAPRTCAACTGHRPLNGDQAVAHRGTVGNRLDRAIDLCADCHSFVRQTANPGTHDGRLPTPDEIAHHDQRGRWRLRIEPRPRPTPRRNPSVPTR